MKQKFFIPLFMAVALFPGGGLASPDIEIKDSAIILKGGGAEYHFDNGKYFHLRNASYQGKPLSITKLDLTYLIHNGDWYGEESPFPDYNCLLYTSDAADEL